MLTSKIFNQLHLVHHAHEGGEQTERRGDIDAEKLHGQHIDGGVGNKHQQHRLEALARETKISRFLCLREQRLSMTTRLAPGRE